METNDNKLRMNFKFIRGLVSALRRGAYAAAISAVLPCYRKDRRDPIHALALCVVLFMVCCGWCGVAMAQTGDGSSALQLRVRVFLEAPLGTATAAPLAVRVQHVASALQLGNRGAEATTQVQVVVDATDTAAELTMTISTDAAGDKVVTIPSDPIVIAADSIATQRSAQFELTAKTTGTATVRITVTDGTNNTMVALRVIVEEPPHTIAVIEPQVDTELQLLSRGPKATMQVQVMIDATDTAAELMMTISTDAAGAEIVTIPSDPIVIAADDDARRRSTQFELMAKKAGTATVRIAVTDGINNAMVALRVIVEELPHTIAVIEPQVDTELRLLVPGSKATTQVQVVVDATDTAAELMMTISTDAAGAEIVAIPSDPIVIATDDDAMRRSTQFELTAKTTGTATVRIAVTDGANTVTAALRVVVAEPLPLRLLSLSDGTQIALVRGDGSTAATQVEVILVQPNVGVPVVLDLQLERTTMSPVFISANSLTLTASADSSTRTHQFTLAAAEAGNTTLTLVASDSLENRAVVTIRVSVERLSELCESCLVPDMRTVPAGTFMMGTPTDEFSRFANESPQRQVNIGYAFAVGQYELTREQYRVFTNSTGFPQRGSGSGNAHPITFVSWSNAKAYLSWLSKETGEEWRLLSEAEWEYAARAGTNTNYSFGNTIDTTQARFDSSTGTVAVGSYAANAFGLYDMHGNVSEWVEDCWHENYTDAPPTDGSAWLNECTNADRVQRGGDWGDDSSGFLRSTFRSPIAPGHRSSRRGIRIARTLEP